MTILGKKYDIFAHKIDEEEGSGVALMTCGTRLVHKISDFAILSITMMQDKEARQHRTARPIAGFSILEIIVVVVVIGILASLSVVSYSLITQNSRMTTLSADLSRAAGKLKAVKANTGGYPTTEAAAAAYLEATNEDAVLQYAYDSVTGNFCITGTIQTESVYITPSATEAQSGRCDAHSSGE